MATVARIKWFVSSNAIAKMNKAAYAKHSVSFMVSSPLKHGLTAHFALDLT